jgi:3-isopropylmalate/(R)-2-methylmalate dehydratase small subunit
MDPFTTVTGIAVPLNRVNVDTDQIIPKQFLKSIEKTGFGQHLFNDWRFAGGDKSRPNPDFILNRPEYQGARVLVAGDNFGCGSSREHAPWALGDYGFRCVISSSFADIFYNNSTKNGLLPAIVTPAELEALMAELEANPGEEVRVDLKEQVIATPKGLSLRFQVGEDVKHSLLNGLDDIGRTLQHLSEIEALEERHKKDMPWL